MNIDTGDGGIIAAIIAVLGGGMWVRKVWAATKRSASQDDTVTAIQEGYTTEVARLQALVALLGPMTTTIAEQEAGMAGAKSMLNAVQLCPECTRVNAELIERIQIQMNKLVPRLDRRRPHEPETELSQEARRVVADFHLQQYGSPLPPRAE